MSCTHILDARCTFGCSNVGGLEIKVKKMISAYSHRKTARSGRPFAKELALRYALQVQEREWLVCMFEQQLCTSSCKLDRALTDSRC